MKNTKVVHLGQVRDLMLEWAKVRTSILAGDVTGFSTTIRGREEEETIYLGGVYKNDPHAALRAALKVSAARTLLEDEPPVLAASQA